MIILLSPAKTFKNTNVIANANPFNLKKSMFLINTIKKMDIDEISKQFKISFALAEKTKSDYLTINNKFAAIYQYNGASYKALNPDTIDPIKLKNVYILSGLYGILNAFDGISPYRLEITSTFLGSLYDYWKTDVNEYLINNLNEQIIINLASNEYSKSLSVPNIITINFVSDFKKINSMTLKKTRGLFARNIIESCRTLNDIKKLRIEDFVFYQHDIKNKVLIFKKENNE